jgi:vitamin B12 transporter
MEHMQIKHKLISLFLTIFAAIAAADAGASLSGVVKDAQGKPVPGATVTLFSQTGAAGDATTSDSAGKYRFEGLPGGRYLLRVEAAGFSASFVEGIELGAAGQETREIALQLAGVRQEVVVTASSTPQTAEQVSKAVTVVDHSEVDARDASSLSDAVAQATSVRVEQLGGPGAYADIRIRGLRAQDTAVLVDGLRLRDASATQADASGLIEDLLFTNADRIEVMRGSGSSLYGTDAIGGVINIITDEGGGRTRGNVLLEGGSLGLFRGRAQVAGGFDHERIQYSLGAAETDVTNGVGGYQPFRDASVQGRMTFHLSPNVRLTARLFGADSFSKVLGEPDILGSPSGFGIVNAVVNSSFTPAPDNPDSTRAARFVTGALTLDGRVSQNLDYSVSYQLVSNGRRYGDGPAGVGYQPDGSTRSLYDGKIQTADASLHYRAGRHNLLSGGYEFENENYANDNSDRSDPVAFSAVNVTQRSHTIFAQDQAQFLDGRLQLSGAVRAQYFTLETPGFAPLAAAPYQGIAFPAPTAAYTGDGSAAYFFRKSGTKLRAHVGRGYRAPSLFERFGAGFDPVFGYTVYGDPRLKPEHSLGLDAGIDQMLFHGRVKASASYFYTWLQDVIQFDTSGLIDAATDPFGRFIGYLNTKGGISRGFEVSAATALTRTLNATVSYTFVNAIGSQPVVGGVLRSFVVPRNQFSMLLTERATSRLFFTADTLVTSNYLDPVYGATVTQVYQFPGMHKVNLGASYRLPMKEYQAVRFFARVDNIFNQTYFENGFLTPGRTAKGGVQFEF